MALPSRGLMLNDGPPSPPMRGLPSVDAPARRADRTASPPTGPLRTFEWGGPCFGPRPRSPASATPLAPYRPPLRQLTGS
eukprot:1280801-Alexandrium_andersonii.AAC.1